MKTVKELLKRFDLLRIPVAFVKRILGGYRLYSRLLSRYGDDTEILATAWRGNGDYYICAVYLKAWLDRNGVEKFIFLTPGGSEEKVLELFPTCAGHTVTVHDKDKFAYLLSMSCFLGAAPCRFHNLHHQQTFPCGNVTGGQLQGFNGLNMKDFYLSLGFGLEPGAPREAPQFSCDRERINKLFLEYRLEQGKTVLLSPYSTGLEKFSPPELFWAELAQKLSSAGFSVCTNCAGDEKPVPGTAQMALAFRDLVPFLDMAGYFIGIRSGLCDVISTSSCKKLVLHTRKAKWWPDGNSLSYTGLNAMGLCDDAVEIEMGNADSSETLERILTYL